MAAVDQGIQDTQPLALRQVQGVNSELRFTHLVTGLITDGLDRAQEAIDAVGIKAGDQNSTYPNLFIDSITTRMIMKESSAMYVDYIARAKEPGFFVFQSGRNYNNGSQFEWSGDTTLTQYNTLQDIFGDRIVVSHTWDGSEELPNGANGKTSFSSDLVNVQIPLTTMVGHGFLRVSYPDAISRGFAGYLNSDIWASEPPGTWKCLRVAFSSADTSITPNLFKFAFEFENNPRGHQPISWYINPRTGKTPVNWVDGQDVVTSISFPSRDIFPFFPI